MTDIIMIIAITALILFGAEGLHAQDEQDSRSDSLPSASPPEDFPEDLVEQAASADESPFLDFNPFDRHPFRREYYLRIRSRVKLALERSRGYEERTYLGSPVSSYDRLEFSNRGGIGGGLLVAKDAGETSLADFSSGYFIVSNAGPITTLLLGDYFIEAGQGIALWKGADIGKGSEVVKSGKRSGRGIVPYSSSDENAFLRGAAVELRSGALSFDLFASRRSLAAALDSSGDVSSLIAAGKYRTLVEKSKRDNLKENLIGVRSSIGIWSGGSAGVTYYRSVFSTRLRLSGASGFTGENYSLASVDCTLPLEGASLFGEWTLLGGPAAGLAGALLTPSRAVTLLAALRRHPRQALTLHGFGFGERPGASGEDGFYMGLRLEIGRGVLFSAYYDRFSFPESSGGNPFPGRGGDWLAHLEFHPAPGLECLVQYQRKGTENRLTLAPAGGLSQARTSSETIQRFRLHLDLHSAESFRIRGRIEEVLLDSGAARQREEGTMIYEDITLAPVRAFSLSARVVLFRSGSYNSRLSGYEDDLDGSISLPLLSGRGERWYLLVRFRPAHWCEVSSKYSRLTRDDLRRIGTGLDELPGNNDDRIEFQCDLEF